MDSRKAVKQIRRTAGELCLAGKGIFLPCGFSIKVLLINVNLLYNGSDIENDQLGGRNLYAWMTIAAVLAFACAVLAVRYINLNRRLQQQNEQAADLETLRREIRAVRGEDVRRRREVASLRRALEDEQDNADALVRDLEYAEEKLREAVRLAEQADARRIRTEKDVYAHRMRADLLEKQIAQLNQEQINQEKLYQDILKERDAQIARLQDSQPRRKPRRRADVLEDQISLDELFGGM